MEKNLEPGSLCPLLSLYIYCLLQEERQKERRKETKKKKETYLMFFLSVLCRQLPAVSLR